MKEFAAPHKVESDMRRLQVKAPAQAKRSLYAGIKTFIGRIVATQQFDR